MSYEERVLEAVRTGHTRPSQIVKMTCLSPEHVRKSLSALRKARKVEKAEDGYRETHLSEADEMGSVGSAENR